LYSSYSNNVMMRTENWNQLVYNIDFVKNYRQTQE